MEIELNPSIFSARAFFVIVMMGAPVQQLINPNHFGVNKIILTAHSNGKERMLSDPAHTNITYRKLELRFFAVNLTV